MKISMKKEREDWVGGELFPTTEADRTLPEKDSMMSLSSLLLFFVEGKVASFINEDDYGPAQAVLVHRLGIHDATPQISPY